MRIRSKRQYTTVPQYQGAVCYDAGGSSFYAVPGAFGRYGAFAGNTATVLIPTQVVGAPGIVFNVNPPGNDPQQTYKDFLGQDKPNVGSAVAFTGVSQTILSNLTKYLGYADTAAQNGFTDGPLAVAADQWIATLNNDAAQCVLYQNNDAGSGFGEDESGRSTTQNANYSKWLHQMQTDMAAAVGALLKADAQEAAYEAAQGGGASAPSSPPSAPAGSNYVPVSAAGSPSYVPTALAQSGATSIFGLDPTTALLIAGGVAVVGFLLLRKPHPAAARSVPPPPPPPPPAAV